MLALDALQFGSQGVDLGEEVAVLAVLLGGGRLQLRDRGEDGGKLLLVLGGFDRLGRAEGDELRLELGVLVGELGDLLIGKSSLLDLRSEAGLIEIRT